MKDINGYIITEKLFETESGVIFKGEKDDTTLDKDRKTFIIHKLKTTRPSSIDIAVFKLEFEKITELDNDGIVRVYEVEKYKDGFILVLEDFTGISLKNLFAAKKIDIREFLEISISLAKTLGHLHSKDIIHREINPENILYDRALNQIKITGFGIVSNLTHINDKIYNTTVVRNYLTYISPEQTGRMNREVDYRSDLYSLGITFFELLAGFPPFVSKDPMELIHSHIARPPSSLSDITSNIPQPVSEIIKKLLSKAPEERYQNSFGLAEDLSICLQHYKESGEVKPFELGKNDIPLRFNIPRKLFGRENEVALLMSAFNRVLNGGKEVLLISGFPGMGKTSIINEIHKPVTENHGYFICGKFEELEKDVPYSAFIKAFQSLVRQIISESKERLEKWKQKLLDALGSNGQVVIDIIPEVELIIGKQPKVPVLGPDASRNRFNIVMEQFTNTFAHKDHPLVFFLDDVQWADSAGFEAIERMVISPAINHILLIFACRDNEATLLNPVTEVIKNIKKQTIQVSEISLQPLNFDHIRDFLADFMKCNDSRLLHLAELICQKTNGNPFFVIQFVKTLYENKLLIPGPLKEWIWDEDAVTQLQVTDNVVELMANKINRLDKNTCDILKICSCLGNRFELEPLVSLTDKTSELIIAGLEDAVSEGLIGRTNYYMFQHDRIQEAVYSLLTNDEKKHYHYIIGKTALAETNDDELKKQLFYVVNQLNLGSGLILDETEKRKIVQLNLKAGFKAKSSSAFMPALNYFKTGISILSSESWKTDYELRISLEMEAAEASYLCNDFHQMDSFVDSVLAHSKTSYEKARILETKVQGLIAQNRLVDAVKTGVYALHLLGVRLPEKPGKLQILTGLIKIKFALLGKKIEDLTDLPFIKNPDKQLAIKILTRVGSASFSSLPELLPLCIFQMVRLSVKYGISPFSPSAFAGYGLFLCGVTGEIDLGNKFGTLAMDLLEKPETKPDKSKTLMVIHHFIRHWKTHIKYGQKQILKGYFVGIETGDPESTAVCAHIFTVHQFFMGVELVELEEQMAYYSNIIKQLNQKTFFVYNEIFRQVIHCFLGRAPNPTALAGKCIDQTTANVILSEDADGSAIMNIYSLQAVLDYYFGNYSDGLKHNELAFKYLDSIVGTIETVLFYFINSLILLRLHETMSLKEKKQAMRKNASNLRKLKKWSSHCPMNHKHKYLIVMAETARVKGLHEQAVDYYNKGIKSAEQNGYLQEKALGEELLALFYLSTDQKVNAGTWMNIACESYQKWGAAAKVEHLENKYPDLLKKTSENQIPEFQPVNLDYHAVVNALQMISMEIVLEDLLRELMKTVVKTAGADTGVFIMQKQDGLYVEAQYNIKKEANNDASDESFVIRSAMIQEYDNLLIPVINLVVRTGEYAVFDDASNESEFITDPHVIKNMPKSVLCLPVVRKAKPVGVLYLENNLAVGAFTQDRIDALELLASQAAISLENAGLYKKLEDHRKNLEKLVDERTAELKVAHKELIDKAHKAGMADIAADILHNVGNILNSVKSSAQVIDNIINTSMIEKLKNANSLLRENIHDLEEFISRNPKGKKLMNYYLIIEEGIDEEHEKVKHHLIRLKEKIQNIEEVVNAQQNYVEAASYEEEYVLSEIIDDAVMMQANAFEKENIKLIRTYDDKSKVLIQKSKLMHILLCLMKNAGEAMVEIPEGKREMRVKVNKDESSSYISIADSGHGIPEENLKKVFMHGFSTKQDRQGFDLHSCANCMTEMSGKIWAESDGKDKGTTFVLKFPFMPG